MKKIFCIVLSVLLFLMIINNYKDTTFEEIAEWFETFSLSLIACFCLIIFCVVLYLFVQKIKEKEFRKKLVRFSIVIIFIVAILYFVFAPSKDRTEDKFSYTWGKLIKSNNGELVYDTLTQKQKELVNYPTLDKEKVYYVPSGKSYHSVDWCYTLSRSDNIFYCTLQDALNKRLSPCSKCVE